MKLVKFIYNPYSGQSFVTDFLDDIVRMHQRHGYLVLPYCITFTAQDETFLNVDCLGSLHHIMVAGGDGTVNYVVNIMKRLGIDVPLAVLPTGTANDFAIQLGMPLNVLNACRQILSGQEMRVDLGNAGGHYFVNVFSCGLFTDVSQKTPTVLKNALGKLAYYLGGLNELPNFRKLNIKLDGDGGSYEGSSLIFFVFNGQTAGNMRLAYNADIRDGLLDVIVVKSGNIVNTFNTVMKFINSGGKSYPDGMLHFQCSRLLVESQSDVTTDIDGQPGPRFPFEICCEKGALRVICPADESIVI